MPNKNRQASTKQNLLWLLGQAGKVPGRVAETVGEAFSSIPFIKGTARQNLGEALYNYPTKYGGGELQRVSETAFPEIEEKRKQAIGRGSGLTPAAYSYFKNIPIYLREKERGVPSGSRGYNPARDIVTKKSEGMFDPEQNIRQGLLDPIHSNIAALLEGFPPTSNVREKYMEQLYPGSIRLSATPTGEDEDTQRTLFNQLMYQSPVPRFRNKAAEYKFNEDFEDAIQFHPSVRSIVNHMNWQAGLKAGEMEKRLKKTGYETLFAKVGEQLGPKARSLPFIGKYYKPIFSAEAERNWQPYKWSIFHPDNVRDITNLPYVRKDKSGKTFKTFIFDEPGLYEPLKRYEEKENGEKSGFGSIIESR